MGILFRYVVELETLEWLARVSDGDARIALNSFQMALESLPSHPCPARLSHKHVKEGIKVNNNSPKSYYQLNFYLWVYYLILGCAR